MKQETQIKFVVIAGALLVAVVACVAALSYASLMIWGLFDDTTVTFRNDSGKPCTVSATVVDVERGESRSEHRHTLPASGTATIEVQHGIKKIEYAVDGKEGTISFDMWHGEDVVLAIDREKTLERVWDRRQ